MDKNTLTLFARYNKVCNEAMDTVIKTLKPEEWNRELGGFFKSVQGLCSHLYVCDFNWLKRFSTFRDFVALKDPLFNRERYSFKELLFEDMADYLSARPVLDEKISAFAAELSPADMEGLLKYTDSSGTPNERNFGGLIMQSLNHDTHHRGMISLCLEILGRENDFSSFGQVIK
ncbi:hypothetical protein AGMMS50230_20690 [Spirochaetia bacterium]|nr:hypothetical protein AGMMS50230_20690 [Spirochaetia bacterium]